MCQHLAVALLSGGSGMLWPGWRRWGKPGPELRGQGAAARCRSTPIWRLPGASGQNTSMRHTRASNGRFSAEGRDRWVAAWIGTPCQSSPPTGAPSRLGREDEVTAMQLVMPEQGDFRGGEVFQVDIHHRVVAIEVVANLNPARVGRLLGADELEVRLRV
jgi:hypothetical protein